MNTLGIDNENDNVNCDIHTPNKAQHSEPFLPDEVTIPRKEYERLRHAAKLAEALRIDTVTLETVLDNDPKNIAAKCCIARNKQALAAYEAAQ